MSDARSEITFWGTIPFATKPWKSTKIAGYTSQARPERNNLVNRITSYNKPWTKKSFCTSKHHSKRRLFSPGKSATSSWSWSISPKKRFLRKSSFTRERWMTLLMKVKPKKINFCSCKCRLSCFLDATSSWSLKCSLNWKAKVRTNMTTSGPKTEAKVRPRRATCIIYTKGMPWLTFLVLSGTGTFAVARCSVTKSNFAKLIVPRT